MEEVRPEVGFPLTAAAAGGGAGGRGEDVGRGVTASCSSSVPISVRDMEEGDQDESAISDYYEFACRLEEEEEAEGGGRRGWLGRVDSSLSFRTCSSAPSSPHSTRSLSIDFGDFPPMSEWEEVASRRWLRILDAAESDLPPPSTSAPGEDEQKKPSRRWLLPPFLRPWLSAESGGSGDGGEWRKDGADHLLWYKDLGRYAFGDFSVAVGQANDVLEDQFQIESGPFGAFVGVYDGHGGPEAAGYVCDHLYRNFRVLSSGPLDVTSEAIEAAFLQTDEEFIAMVRDTWNFNPKIAITGSCCLVGVICHHTLHVANLGDSRVVLATKAGNTGKITAIQLSTEHNVNIEAARDELMSQNRDDPRIVILKNGIWRVKGIIQVSRSIGDAYMKHAEFNSEPLYQRFRISGPMNMPILSSRPTIISHNLCQNDSFLIFASDGLWEQLSNEEAINIVHSHPHGGAARRLIKAAMHEAAKKREIKYSHLHRIDRKVRRHFHDDMTVIVLFLNHDLVSQPSAHVPSLSVTSSFGVR